MLNNDCIIKPIRSGFVDDKNNERVVFTTLLEKEHFDLMENTESCPLSLQKNIKKSADVRVTIVGNQIFSARIDSQMLKETSIDWRKGNSLALTYEKNDLPLDIQSRCIDLVKTLDLEFGAIDLVLDLHGNYIFLEINPNGQWAWIETRLNYDISGAIIDGLTRGGW